MQNIIYVEEKARSPLENLAMNMHYADMAMESKHGILGRIYSHSRGVILGNTQSTEDLFEDACVNEGYQIVRRPSGGSAIITETGNNLCYSLFFDSKRFGGDFDFEKAYKAITIPIAKRFGDDFSVKGIYYMRHNHQGQDYPIAGHAMKLHGRDIVQFDGVIQMEDADSESISKVLKLRKLYMEDATPLIEMDGQLYTPKGKEIHDIPHGAKLDRDEYEEISGIRGMKSIGISVEETIGHIIDALREEFGKIEMRRGEKPKSKDLESYMEDIRSSRDIGKRRCLGHCFVDFADSEPEIHYEKEK